MEEDKKPRHAKKDRSNRTRNILIAVIVSLSVILLAVLITFTFCTRQDLEDIPEPEQEEEVDDGAVITIEDREGIIDRITEKYIELDVEETIVILYFDGYVLPEDISAGDRIYVEYKVDKALDRNILIYLKILEKAHESEEPNIVKHVGVIETIQKDWIELIVSDYLLMIYIDGYILPDDLAVGDKVFVEYEVDKTAEQNILKKLEVLEKAEIIEAPTITLEIYEGPEYLEKDNVCYYRIRALTTGTPAPVVSWNRDDSGGNLGQDIAQINLKNVDEKYVLEATAKNSGGTAKEKMEIKWGCKKPPVNNPPEIKEIIIMEDFYTDTEYPVYVIAVDPDGDDLSYKWNASAGSVRKSSGNPMFWTTPGSEGTYEIKVTVDDGNNGVATKSEKVKVKMKEPSIEPPELEITDNIWQWERFISGEGAEETTVQNPEQYMLFLESGGNMYLLADCNSGSGIYSINKNNLNLDIRTITRAICEEDSLSDVYISYLTDITSYIIEDEELILELEEDKGTMVFGMVELVK